MPASSNSPLAREEGCEGTVQFWLSYKLTTPRRNIFKIDLASRSGAGRSLRVVEVTSTFPVPFRYSEWRGGPAAAHHKDPFSGQTNAGYEGDRRTASRACAGIGYSKIPVAALSSIIRSPPWKDGRADGGDLPILASRRANGNVNFA